MRLTRYEIMSPGGIYFGMLTALSFLRGTQFANGESGLSHINAITKPFTEKLKAPNLPTPGEYRFFFTNAGNRRFKKDLAAVIEQAHIERWTPIKTVVRIPDDKLPVFAYQDKDQVAISMAFYEDTPKKVEEIIL